MAASLKCFMRNLWYRTAPETFNEPAGEQLVETVRVVLDGNILRIEAVDDATGNVKLVMYARRSVDLPQKGVHAFVVVEDNLQHNAPTFPATGTAILYQHAGKWRLEAVGYTTPANDKIPKPEGWIFHAEEIGAGEGGRQQGDCK
jgi:hypothetical protein